MNPLERLRDDFPHGTLEGERAGCVTKDCPARPLQCWEVARGYRIDMRFKRAYQAGARGAELADLNLGRGEAAAGDSAPAPRKRAARAAKAPAPAAPEASASTSVAAPVDVEPSHAAGRAAPVVVAELANVGGPQLAAMFVVVNERREVVAASTHAAAASAALAEAWKQKFVPEGAQA